MSVPIKVSVSGVNNSIKKRRCWTDYEVFELIKLWNSYAFQLKKNRRHGHLYVEMSKKLSSYGIPVLPSEVHIKVNNLTQRYRTEVKTARTARVPSTWQFLKEVGKVFKTVEAELSKEDNEDSHDYNLRELSTPSFRRLDDNNDEETCFSSFSETLYKKETESPEEIGNTSHSREIAVLNEANQHGDVYDIQTNGDQNHTEEISINSPAAAPSEDPLQVKRANQPLPTDINENHPNAKKRRIVEHRSDLVSLIKNIIGNQKPASNEQTIDQNHDKIDTFSNFMKSYLKKWPERVQDEAINHITNYLVSKNMDFIVNSNH